MILLSVAHSKTRDGAINRAYGLSEYPLSQKMTHAAAKHLIDAGVETQVFDAGQMASYARHKINLVNQLMPELAVEIHMNAGRTNSRYAAIFCHRGSSGGNSAADCINEQFRVVLPKYLVNSVRKIEVPSDGFSNDRFWFITETNSPAIIVEPMFISNDQQAASLKEDSTLSDIGIAVANGIIKFMGAKNG